MTKIYDIIYLDNKMYMTDKETKAYGVYFCPHKGKNIDVGAGINPSKPYFFKHGPFDNLCDDCQHIIASNNSDLQNLPILPEVETNKYTKEDMRNAYMTGSISGMNWLKSGISDNEFNHCTKAEEYVQSLSQLPIKVEVKMEDFCDYEGEELWEITSDWRLKIQNNTIQIVKFLYE
jgi:hypothetical protein